MSFLPPVVLEVTTQEESAMDEFLALYENAPKVEAIPALGADGRFIGYLIQVNDKIVAIWNEDNE